MTENKTYTLKEVKETFFPSFQDCDGCRGFFHETDLNKCFTCDGKYCDGCIRHHRYCVSQEIPKPKK